MHYTHFLKADASPVAAAPYGRPKRSGGPAVEELPAGGHRSPEVSRGKAQTPSDSGALGGSNDRDAAADRSPRTANGLRHPGGRAEPPGGRGGRVLAARRSGRRADELCWVW